MTRIPLTIIACWTALAPGALALGDEKGGQGQNNGPAQKPRVVVKPARPKLPERVALPTKGDCRVEDLLSIAGSLSGRVVRIENDRVRETPVTITEDAAGSKVTFEELKLLLAAHRVYLFEFTDSKEGEILVASRNPKWKDEPDRHTKILDVGSANFAKAWAKIQKAVEDKNALLPGGEPAFFAVPDERTGKIFLGGPSEEALEALATGVEAKKEREKDPDRVRLYTYTGEHRRVEDLQKDLLEKLNESERNRLRIVVSSRGNRLLLSAPSSLWETVEARLKELDKKK